MTPLRCLRFILLGLLAALASVHAQSTGSIEGRVLNTGTGEYLENARVTLEGTALETLTDGLGQYRFATVPAGPAQVKVFFTGLVVETAAVNVAAGQIATRDFNLAAFDAKPAAPATPGASVVKLGSFVG